MKANFIDKEIIMKIVAIILNNLLTVVIIPIFIAVPIINLIGFAYSTGWIQKYFKRKTLEEKQ